MHRLVLAVALLVAACGGTSNNHSGDGGGGGGDGGGGGGDGGGTNVDANLSGTSAITIIVEPNGNKASELVSAINAATTSVYMTMYEIDNDDIINALVARAQAHVDVEAVLDATTGTAAQGDVNNMSFNMDAYTKLTAAGVSVVWSNTTRFTFTHEKTIIIDQKVAWIMTMNANESTPEDNREYLAIDTDAADIAEATAIFKADHANTVITPTGSLVVADTNARAMMVALINTATTALDIEDEEFSDTNSNGIVSAVVAAAKRGVAVRVVIGNSGTTSAQTTAIGDVKTAGGSVVITGPTSGDGTASNPYIHAKAILIDCDGTNCKNGWVGSENMTAGSLGYNRELGVIFAVPTELAKIKTAIDTDFAAGTAQ